MKERDEGGEDPGRADASAPTTEEPRKEKTSEDNRSEVVKDNVAFRRGPTERILQTLEALDHEANPTTLARLTRLPIRTVTATLSRLLRQNQVSRLHRGFYSLKPRLNWKQGLIAEARRTVGFHNLLIVRDGPLPTPKQLNEDTVPPDPVASPGVVWAVSVPLVPGRTLTLIGHLNSTEARLGASEDPLTAREVPWLPALLQRMTGTSWAGARVSKVDANMDLPATLSGLQELTLEDFAGRCLAIYRKGSGTRVELRNVNPGLTVAELLARLAENFGLERQPEDTGSGRPKDNRNNPKTTRRGPR